MPYDFLISSFCLFVILTFYLIISTFWHHFMLTYKALHNLAPFYLSNLLQLYTPTRSLRSLSADLLRVPNFKLSSFGGKAFSCAAAKLWNSLPLHIRHLNCISLFKDQIKPATTQYDLFCSSRLSSSNEIFLMPYLNDCYTTLIIPSALTWLITVCLSCCSLTRDPYLSSRLLIYLLPL